MYDGNYRTYKFIRKIKLYYIKVSVGEIEAYINKIKQNLEYTPNALIWEILKKYQGAYFEDEVVSVISSQIPILGDSNRLEFGAFLEVQSIYSILNSNQDLFERRYLPFAEATPGDFIALDCNKDEVVFISHDYTEEEGKVFFLADTITKFILGLVKIDEDEDGDDLESEWFSDDF